MEAITSLQACVESLASLSDTPCDFVHENSDREDPLQCSAIDQERCLGCAHSGLVILRTAVAVLKEQNILSSDDAASIKTRLLDTSRFAMQSDFSAKHEYDQDGRLSDETQNDHRTVIRRRAEVRDELIAIASIG